MVRFNRMKGIILLSILYFFTGSLYAQNSNDAIIKGTIKAGNIPLEYATIYLNRTSISTSSNKKGEFILRVPQGEHRLGVRYVGYKTYAKRIEVEAGKVLVFDINLQEENPIRTTNTVTKRYASN